MKRHIPSILSIMFLLICLLGPADYAGANNLAMTNGVPGLVSYQGQVNVDGHPFSGTGSFKFAIIDPPGTTSYWSNDGTSTGGSQPTHAVELPVANGLFNVLLGDAALAMPPLTPAVFSDPSRQLRVWFSPNDTTFTQLAPDTPITSVPYALQAQVAADSAALNGHPASDFMTFPHYLGRSLAYPVDTTGDVGESNSITIGSDGLGLISYTYNTGIDLRVLHCGNLMCNGGNTITSLDTIGWAGEFTSIAIGADGLGLISYFDGTNGHLKVLHCGNLLCDSGNTITSVDTSHDVGEYGTSITIGADGLGLVSYYDGTNNDLKVLHCGNLLCSSGNTSTSVDTAGDTGMEPSITIGADGLGLVSYVDVSNYDLKVLHCGNLLCSSLNIITSVDTAGDVGWSSSLTIGTDGLGLISYTDATNYQVKLLHCGNLLCNNGNTIAIVKTDVGMLGGQSSITIGADGLGIISFFEGNSYDLEVAKLSGLGRR